MSNLKNFMEQNNEISEIKASLGTASPEQLKKFFDSFAKNDLTSDGTPRTLESCDPYTLQYDKNGNLGLVMARLNDKSGLGVLKTKDGFSVIRGKIKEMKNGCFSIYGNDYSDYDTNSILLKRTIYQPDNSYSVQHFENGHLASTSFYDKDNNLIKKSTNNGKLPSNRGKLPDM